MTRPEESIGRTDGVRRVITIAQDVRYITELYLNIAHLIEGIR